MIKSVLRVALQFSAIRFHFSVVLSKLEPEDDLTL
jgi:hypothetical protein